MKADIINIIDIVRSSEFKGGTELIEIAKGKFQMVETWNEFIRKLKRQINKR